MDQTVRMGLVERAGDLGQDGQRSIRFEPPGQAQDRRQAGAFDEAHREVELAIDLAGVVDVDDVRVAERGRQARLAQEPIAERLVLGHLRDDDLQRDPALERGVLGGVDDAHPATPDQGLDDVSAELIPDGQGHGHPVSLNPALPDSVSNQQPGYGPLRSAESDRTPADRLVRETQPGVRLALVHVELVV